MRWSIAPTDEFVGVWIPGFLIEMHLGADGELPRGCHQRAAKRAEETLVVTRR